MGDDKKMIQLGIIIGAVIALVMTKVFADAMPPPPTVPVPAFANTLEKAKVASLWCGDNGNCKVDVFECLIEKQEPEYQKCFVPDYADL